MKARTSRAEFRNFITDLSRHDRSIAFLIFGFLLACYLLTYSGRIQSSDGLSMFATSESIVRRGDADTNQLLWMGLQQGSFGPNGDLYSRKGLGMALLALPLVWLAHKWAALGLVQAALLLNPLLTAWTGALVYRSGIRLGWSRYVAVITALVYGLATLAWPYTQTFFSDPVAAWGLFGCFYGLLSFQQTQRKRYLFAAGLAWGLAYLARAVNLVTLPIYALGLLAILDSQTQGALDQAWRWHVQTLATKIRTLVGDHPRQWISFALPIVVAGLLSLWWNWLRFGSIWQTGYLETESFSGVWWFGVYGLLFGPGRGLLWYSPVLLLSVFGVGWFWRRARWIAAVALILFLVYVLLYGKWYMWHGGYSWGPRFLVPMVPFLALLTGPAWDRIFIEQRWAWPGRAATLLLVILSLTVQWLGLLVPFSLVQDRLVALVEPLFAPQTFTQWRYSPLILQWEFLQAEHMHFAWWQAGAGGPDWFSFALLLAGVAAGGILIARQVRNSQMTAAGNLQEGDSFPNWFYGLALGLVALVVLVRYQSAFSGPGMLEIARQLAIQEEPGDAILFLRPPESQEFANAYHGNLATYGLFPTRQLSDSDQALLAKLEEKYRRLWVIPDFTPPEQSGWERTLRQSAFLLLDNSAQWDDQRLVLYAFANAQPLTETGLGTIFGAPQSSERDVAESGWVRLNGYGFTQQTHPGGELLVALEWQSLRRVDHDYQVFVHLLNAQDEKLAQRDGQPVLWLRPTSTWQPGEKIVDRYGLLLPDDLPPGQYRIAVGLYDPETNERLSVSAGPQDYAIELGPIEVIR